jgi:hypothetical protein
LREVALFLYELHQFFFVLYLFPNVKTWGVHFIPTEFPNFYRMLSAQISHVFKAALVEPLRKSVEEDNALTAVFQDCRVIFSRIHIAPEDFDKLPDQMRRGILLFLLRFQSDFNVVVPDLFSVKLDVHLNFIQ